MLARHKESNRSNRNIYLCQWDADDSCLQLAVYAGGDFNPSVTVFVDGVEAKQLWPAKRTSTFFGSAHFTSHRFWIHVPEGARLSGKVFGEAATFRKGGSLGKLVSLDTAVKSLKPAWVEETRLPPEAKRLRAHASSRQSVARYGGCWLFMDRDDAADDNAEHFYRYMLRRELGHRAYFVLRRNSPDWARLEAEGFRLLAFGSDDHVAALANAEILASSHADHYVMWPVPSGWIRDLTRHRFVFLQHGVTRHDLSDWLNGKPIRLLVASAVDEVTHIGGLESKYVFSDREVKLTGFPRHDALMARQQSHEHILVMPTWRRYLVGERTGGGSQHDRIVNFGETRYARSWRSLLTSVRLRELAERHGKRIMFCPHPLMAVYLDEWDLPEHIDIRDPLQPPSLQKTFADAAMLITDYSSVAFDCAYIDKPVAYYQFDRDEIYSGSHLYRGGYFDDKRDGFGPVAEDLDQLLDVVERTLDSGDDEIYATRRQKFFRYRDGNCCRRVYEEILKILPGHSADCIEIRPETTPSFGTTGRSGSVAIAGEQVSA